MIFSNPFTQKITKVQSDLKRCNDAKQTVVADLKWYHAFNLEDNQIAAEKMHNDIIDKRDQIGNYFSDISTLSKHLSDLRNDAAPVWKLKIYFSDIQRNLRKRIKNIADAIKTLEQKKRDREAEIDLINSKLNQLNKSIHEFLNFDELSSQNKIDDIDVRIGALENELNDLKEKSASLVTLISTDLDELNSKNKELEVVETEIKEAKYFERSLSNAQNSYERAMAHQACENRFGESKPNRVINQKERQAKSVQRTIAKITERIEKKIERHNREIKHLIFDGNNFCYCGQDFIGLGALLPCVKNLEKRFHITIIFDAGIRGLMQANDKQISGNFNKKTDVHIVATREKADETILAYAGTENTTYIITNDRFADFSDTAAVKEKRLIRHEILKDRAFIHDLNLNIKYEAAVPLTSKS